MGFTAILTLIFVACKLLGIVTWSWWIVFSPIIIGWVLGIFLIALFGILAFFANR